MAEPAEYDAIAIAVAREGDTEFAGALSKAGYDGDLHPAGSTPIGGTTSPGDIDDASYVKAAETLAARHGYTLTSPEPIEWDAEGTFWGIRPAD